MIKTACDAGADAEMFPDDWLFHHRWGKVAGEVGGEPIQFITVGGRTTAFVPKRQKKTSEKHAAGVKAEPKKRGAENDEPSKAPAKKAAVRGPLRRRLSPRRLRLRRHPQGSPWRWRRRGVCEPEYKFFFTKRLERVLVPRHRELFEVLEPERR